MMKSGSNGSLGNSPNSGTAQRRSTKPSSSESSSQPLAAEPRLHQHLPNPNEMCATRVPPVIETGNTGSADQESLISPNNQDSSTSDEKNPKNAQSSQNPQKSSNPQSDSSPSGSGSPSSSSTPPPLTNQSNINQTLPPSKRNVICFGQLYFLEGISYGHLVGFLPLVLTKYYDVNIAKISFMRITFLPWLLKPFFAKLFKQPNKKTVLKSWISLVLVSLIWLLIYWFVVDMRKLDHEKAMAELDEDKKVLEAEAYSNSVYKIILIYGVTIQFCTAIFDVIVDFIQITTLKTRKTLGWVKTLETGLYKIGSMIAGSLLLNFVQSITTSLMVLCVLYVSVGSIALFIFKLPNDVKDIDITQESQEILHPEKSNTDTTNPNCDSVITSPSPTQMSKNASFWDSIWKTKYFFVYLVTYKMFQGSFQTLVPIWMLKEACIDLKKTNIVSGIIPAVTSLLGTILGGGIPAKIMMHQKKVKEENRGYFKSLFTDIWFWLLTVMLVFSVISFGVMGMASSTVGEDVCQAKTGNSSVKNDRTFMLDTEISAENQSVTYIFCFMFIAIGFIGGILTPVTFTEMTAKAQDNVHISQANSYLSWLSTFEIVGKYCWGIAQGHFVEWFGYQKTFLMWPL